MSEEWQKYIPVMERLLWQCYYRILSFISFPAPVTASFNVATHLSESLGGDVYWIKENYMFRWDNVEFTPGITMSIWIFGGKRNTVMARSSWWTMYVLEERKTGPIMNFLENLLRRL